MSTLDIYNQVIVTCSYCLLFSSFTEKQIRLEVATRQAAENACQIVPVLTIKNLLRPPY